MFENMDFQRFFYQALMRFETINLIFEPEIHAPLGSRTGSGAWIPDLNSSCRHLSEVMLIRRSIVRDPGALKITCVIMRPTLNLIDYES